MQVSLSIQNESITIVAMAYRNFAIAYVTVKGADPVPSVIEGRKSLRCEWWRLTTPFQITPYKVKSRNVESCDKNELMKSETLVYVTHRHHRIHALEPSDHTIGGVPSQILRSYLD